MVANYLTQRDVDDYGHDVLDLAQRAALHALAPDLQALNHANADLRAQLAQERQRGLHPTLDAQIPDWRQIDSDPRWRQWLLLPHEYSNRPRQMHLNDAIQAADAARVISFFRGFLREGGAAPRPEQEPHRPAATGGKRTYTRAQIEQASRDFLRGRIAPDAYAKLSADMHAAIKENRIVGPMPMRGVGKTRV